MDMDVVVVGDETNWQSIGHSVLTEAGEKKHMQYARIDPRIGRLFLLGTMMVTMLKSGRLPPADMFVMLWGVKDEVKRMSVCQRDERVSDLCARAEALLEAGLRTVNVQLRLLTPRAPSANQIN